MNDFKAQLHRQIKFIRNSCKAYEQGDVEEAVRIAVTLRVLFYDSGKSMSLLSHLRAKPIKLLTTAAPFVKHPLIPNLYLVQPVTKLNFAANREQDSMRCVCEPLLGTSLRNENVDFDVWWNGESIIEHKQPSSKMRRKELVLSAANKDGGAHVDMQLNPIYDYVRRGSGQEIALEFQPQWGRTRRTLVYENIHFASLRQIGYEVLNSPAILALLQ